MTETTITAPNVNEPSADQLAARVADAGAGPGSTPAPKVLVTQPDLNSAYNGPSIVDYLSSVGKPHDYNSRVQLAKENGFDNYSGSGPENDALLAKIRGGAPSGTPAPTINTGGTSFGADVQKILDQYGITPPDPNSNPTTAFSDTYKQLYTNLGLDTVKGHIDTVLGQLGELDKGYQDEIDQLKNNPWISEQSRNVRIRELTNKLNAEKGNLSHQLTLYEKLYDSGRQDAQYVATKTLESTHQNDTLHQQVILKAIDQAEKEMTARTALAKKATTASTKKTPTTPTGPKITLSEAQKNNWPLSVVGMSQHEIAQSFSSETPPKWFTDKLQNEKGQTVIPSVVKDTWQPYRQKFLSSSSANTTATEKPTPNYSKALSYFKGTYGTAISDTDAQALAGRVDLYVKGGQTYAKAVQQVISEASQ